MTDNVTHEPLLVVAKQHGLVTIKMDVKQRNQTRTWRWKAGNSREAEKGPTIFAYLSEPKIFIGQPVSALHIHLSK